MFATPKAPRTEYRGLVVEAVTNHTTGRAIYWWAHSPGSWCENMHIGRADSANEIKQRIDRFFGPKPYSFR